MPVRALPVLRRLTAVLRIQGVTLLEHPLDVHAVALRRVAQVHVRHRADDPTVLEDRAAAFSYKHYDSPKPQKNLFFQFIHAHISIFSPFFFPETNQFLSFCKIP